jgi:peptidyl-prolyl cis-trans isomerase D
MISLMRRFLDTWAAKVFFLVLVGMFGLWGVSGSLSDIASQSSVAVVGSRKIEMPEMQEAYRRQLAQVTKMFGTNIQPTAEIKRAVAGQALEQLVTFAALDQMTASLHLAVPDAFIAEAVREVPAFKGRTGAFDRDTYEQVLRANGYTPKRFETQVKTDIAQRQLLETLRAGTAAPEALARPVFEFQRETRLADAVDVLFASTKPPESPTQAQIERFHENNIQRYSTAELRRVRAVILAPAQLANDVTVSDDEISAAYAQNKASYNAPEKRSVQVLLTQDEATATKLALTWRDFADWTAIQKQASDAGGAPVELADAAQVEFPAPELGAAVFAARLNEIPPPVHSALGWHVLKVTAITPGSARSLADVTPELRRKVALDKAADLLATRAHQVEDQLSAGVGLENLPGDLGLAPIVGTLDAQGNTVEGNPAPIPGPAELRPALVQAAFQAKIGDAPHLIEAPNAADGSQSFFAFAVEEITPPAPRKLADVIAQVSADWARDALRHAAEIEAAGLLAKVKAGTSLADAAAADTLLVRALPAVGRSAAPVGVPTELVNPLFTLKPGEPTMVETSEGFMVAVLVKIVQADPAGDAAGFAELRTQLARAMADDTEALFAVAVRDRANPKLNRALLDTLVQGD